MKEDPVGLEMLLDMIVCYKKLNIQSEELKKAEILLKTIARYGDGTSKEESFKVISIGDEYVLLNYLNIDFRKYIRTSEISQSDIIDI